MRFRKQVVLFVMVCLALGGSVVATARWAGGGDPALAQTLASATVKVVAPAGAPLNANFEVSQPYWAGWNMKLRYDPAKLTVVSMASGGVCQPASFWFLNDEPPDLNGGCAFQTSTATGDMDIITFQCKADGVVPLHLVGVSEDPVAGTTIFDENAVNIPTTLVDATVTCAGGPSPTPTFTPSPAATPTFTPTRTPTFTPSPTVTPTHTPMATDTPSPMPTTPATETPTVTSTATPVETETATPEATHTATPVQTGTPTHTATSVATNTPTATATRTGTPTATPTVRTATPTKTATPRTTATATATSTPVSQVSPVAGTPTPPPTGGAGPGLRGPLPRAGDGASESRTVGPLWALLGVVGTVAFSASVAMRGRRRS